MKTKIGIMKRILCLTLIGLLLIGALASCSKKDETETEESETSASTDEIFTGPKPYMDDFGGYEFKVLTRGSGAWQSNDISGEVMGNVLDQTVYVRNETVSKKYNFEIVETKTNDWVAMARNTASSESDTFDMWSFKMNDIPTLAQEGYLYDLREVSYINLEADYYDQKLLQHGTFANYVFFLVGDLLYQDDMATQCVLFNNKIWTDSNLGSEYGVNSMYELVESGKWTLEVFEQLARKTTVDNGDGEWNDKDQWGFNHENVDILALNIALGNNLLSKDADDIFVLDKSEKQVNSLQSIMKLLNSGYSYSNDGGDSLFMAGKQFISMNWVGELPTFLNSNVDYGIIPPCKADSDSNTEYRSFITTYGSNCITICKAVQDVNKSASIIELLSYESQSSVTPKLSDYLFGGRLINHHEDANMLKYIIDHRSYELCYLWSTGSLYSTMIGINNADGQGISSALQSCESAVSDSVARKLERLENLS